MQPQNQNNNTPSQALPDQPQQQVVTASPVETPKSKRPMLVIVSVVVGIVIVVLIVVLTVVLLSMNNKKVSQEPNTPSTPSVVLSAYDQSTPAKQTPDAKTYRDLMNAAHASISSSNKTQATTLGTYKGYSVSGFDISGKSGDSHARFGEFINESTVSLCFSDFQNNVSIRILYDGNSRWNGNNALVLFLSDTNCSFDKSYTQIVSALWLDLDKDGNSIDYSGATPGDSTTTPQLTSMQQSFVDELKASQLDTNIAAHWIGSF